MNTYYYETGYCSRGWRKYATDYQAINGFKGYGSIRVWRVEQDGAKTLILKRNNKKPKR